jgi:hypothetical protein
MSHVVTGDSSRLATPENTCPCGHPESTHDLIAARYCRATISGALPRGCICQGRDFTGASGS